MESGFEILAVELINLELEDTSEREDVEEADLFDLS